MVFALIKLTSIHEPLIVERDFMPPKGKDSFATLSFLYLPLFTKVKFQHYKEYRVDFQLSPYIINIFKFQVEMCFPL